MRVVFASAAALSLLCACIVDPRAGEDPPVDEPEIIDTGYPAPRADRFPAVGGEASLDVATWNIENFPANGDTASFVADFITSMELDLVAVQEIADLEAWQELIDRLPEHDGVISNHTYQDGSFQKVGFIYKTPLLQVDSVTTIFRGAGFEFPRPPFTARFTTESADGPFDFTAIVVHLKAGTDSDDRERRAAAMLTLEDHIRDLVDGPEDDDIILLGDFNEQLNSGAAREVFDPFLDEPGRYTLHTDALPASATSFIPAGILLDHILTTASLEDEIAGEPALIPELDRSLGAFEGNVSDHLPVVLSLPIY